MNNSNAIRVGDGAYIDADLGYISFNYRGITPQQWKALDDFIFYCYSHNLKGVDVELLGFGEYLFKDYDNPEDIIKEIKRVYNSNNLNEDYTEQDVLNNLYLDENGFEEFNVEVRSFPDDCQDYDEYNAYYYFYGIMLNDNNIGNVAIVYDYDDNIMLIDGIKIDENFRSKGIGKKTIELLIKEHHNVKKIVCDAVPNAKEFYKKLGFKSKDKVYFDDFITNMELKINSNNLQEDYDYNKIYQIKELYKKAYDELIDNSTRLYRYRE